MNNEQFLKACEKELKYIKKQERKIQRQAMDPGWGLKKALETVIPQKVHVSLRAAFATAFTIIFEKGLDVIEKTYNKENLLKDFESRDMAIDQAATHRELKRFRNNVAKSKRWKSIATTAEGVGLGALGIGLPDIVLFIGFMLQSVYEVALKYGYDYENPQERMLILKMMAASIKRGKKWIEADMEVNEMIDGHIAVANGKAEPQDDPEFDEIQEQIAATADTFAIDMLVLKFIQGLPVVGIVGGLSNPIYYSKIMEYVQLKYHKRYLLEKRGELDEKPDGELDGQLRK